MISMLMHVQWEIIDDATSLHQIPDESIESMSALCSLEHFELGRYGDPIDPEACFKCFDNIQRKLKKGGKCTYLCRLAEKGLKLMPIEYSTPVRQ